MGKRNVESYESWTGKKAKLAKRKTPPKLVKGDVTSDTTLPCSNDKQQQNSTLQCMDLESTSNGDNNCTNGEPNEIQPSVNANQSQPMPKTPAERSRDYRARLKAARLVNQNYVSRPAPKTPAERNRLYWARKKELQQQNLEKDEITSGTTLPDSNDKQQNSTIVQCMDLESTSNGDNNYSNGGPNEIQQSVNVNQSKPMPKTPAERSRDYRARLRAARHENQNHVVSWPAPKTWARQNEIQQQNLDEITMLSSSNDVQLQNSTTMQWINPGCRSIRNGDSSDEEFNENQPRVIGVNAKVHHAHSQASIACNVQLQLMSKTPAERSRAYRARHSEIDGGKTVNSSKPKTGAERMQKYRKRQKERQFNEDSEKTNNVDEYSSENEGQGHEVFGKSYRRVMEL